MAIMPYIRHMPRLCVDIIIVNKTKIFNYLFWGKMRKNEPNKKRKGEVSLGRHWARTYGDHSFGNRACYVFNLFLFFSAVELAKAYDKS